MVETLLLLAAAVVTGALVKLADDQADRKVFFFKYGQQAAGVAYGVLLGSLMTASAVPSAVFTAMLAGNIAAGKIDRTPHYVGAAIALCVLAAIGFPQGFSFALFLLLAAAALADEKLHDWSERKLLKNEKVNAIVHAVGENRGVLKLAGLAASAATGEWLVLAAIIAFDLGYVAIEKLAAGATPAVGSLGMHLTIDCFDCSEARLGDVKLLRAFLTQMPAKLGMRAITKPVVKSIDNRRDEGLSGFVMIAESHVSVHTFPRIRACNVDVFSCKPFDAKKTEEEITKWFKCNKARCAVSDRGEAS